MFNTFKNIKWHLVPIACIFGFLPLIMHLSYFKVDPIFQTVLPTDSYPDWFFFYKGLFFVLITIVMLISLVLGQKKYPICRDGYFKIYALSGLTFIGATLFSTYFSPYKDLALIGGPTRYEGLGIMICYIMVMFYTYATFQEIADYRYIVIPFAFTTAIQAFVGFTQRIGRDFTQWKFIRELIAPGEFELFYYTSGSEPWFPKTATTWQGTLGNSNYSGSFISLALPLFVILFFRARSNKQRIGLYFMIFLTLYVTFCCRSRAGLLACIVVFFFLLCIMRPALPHFIKRLKFYFTYYKKTCFIYCSSFLIMFIILVCITPVSERFYYLIRDIRITLTPQSALTLDKPTYPLTENFSGMHLNTDEIQLISASNTLTITFENHTLSFQDGLGHKLFPVTTDQGTYKSFILYRPPYVGYTFEYIVDGSLVHIRLFIDKSLSNDTFDNPICGFTKNEMGEITLTEPRHFEPLVIDFPPTLGFKGKERLGSGRGYIWSRSLPLLKDHLLLGAGPDLFMLTFPYNDFWGKLEFLSTPDICVDKPHNTYLQLWINQGFFAFLAFVSLGMIYLIHCVKLYGFKKIYTQEALFGLALMSSILGYFVASFFNDTTLSVTPLFFALLGSGMAYNVIYAKSIKTLY